MRVTTAALFGLAFWFFGACVGFVCAGEFWIHAMRIFASLPEILK